MTRERLSVQQLIDILNPGQRRETVESARRANDYLAAGAPSIELARRLAGCGS